MQKANGPRPTFYDLAQFAKTGIAAPCMTQFDKMQALAAAGRGIPISTITGEPPLTFRSNGTPLISWSITGNMTQTGTPTPDAPIMPQECGDRTANLFDKDNVLENYYLDNGVPTPYKIGKYVLSDFIPISSSTATISARVTTPSSTGAHWAVYDENKSFIRGGLAFMARDALCAIVVDTSDAAFIRVDYALSSLTDCMLNVGSTPLDYEPYGYALDISCGGETKTIYLREPLRKIGDYADTVSSDGAVTRNIVKIDLAALTWVYITGSNYAIFWALVDRQLIERYKGYSNAFEVTTVAAFSSMPDNSLRVYEGSNRQQRLAIRYDAAEGSVSALKDMLTQNSAMAWLVMEEPETEQYNAPTLTPAKGSNTLSVDTSLAPSGVSITGNIKQT